MNWRGKPLVSLETIINLIAGTTNSTGLEVYARLDESAYPDKINVTNAEFKTINIAAPRVSSRVELHHQATRSLKPLSACCIPDGNLPSYFSTDT